MIEAAQRYYFRSAYEGNGRAPQFEPFVRLNVKGVVLVAQLSRGQALLECLSLGGCSILVRSANVQCFPVSCACRARLQRLG